MYSRWGWGSSSRFFLVQVLGDGADVHDGEKWGHGALWSQPPLKERASVRSWAGGVFPLTHGPFLWIWT